MTKHGAETVTCRDMETFPKASQCVGLFSLCHFEVSQIQRLFAGDAPVVGLLTDFVVLQSGFVVDGQPLDGVCGQSLEGEKKKRCHDFKTSPESCCRLSVTVSRLIFSLTHLQVDDGVRAVSLHGVKLQVALEVFGVESGDGQTVTKTSLNRNTED